MPKLIEKAKEFIGECWHGNTNKDAIFDFLTPNCLHQKTIGKCIGTESFLADCDDWARAFPDYSTEIKEVELYRNVVVIDVQRRGTHLERYLSTNPDKNTILSKSDFFTSIEKLEATGIQYNLPAKLFFSFSRNHISQIVIEENPFDMSIQLGLLAKSKRNPSINGDLDYDKKTVANAISKSLQINLTSREMECLALTFCGFSAKHISEVLKISHRTVESFLANAYQKLDCFGKQQVLEMMYETQVIMLWLDLGKLILQSKWR